MHRRRLILALLLSLAAATTAAAGDFVQEKNFPILTLLAHTSAVARDPELQSILATKRAANDCTSYRFTDDEIARAASALRRIGIEETPEFRRAYVRYRDDRVLHAWTDAAHAINNIIDVYGLGKPPRWPAIDSISFDPKSDDFRELLATANLVVHEEPMRFFFEPSLRFAMQLLAINGRDEAGRFEPLAKTNAAAIRHIGAMAWSKYQYSVILVPGYGPDEPQWRLSPRGLLRVELAARRFHRGDAPLIVVSGGYVHPKQTPYCEAVEMKRALVEKFGVPAEAIVVEPEARHTTTNLRNTARLMIRYGIPLDRPALVTTDDAHSAMIASDAFAQRCRNELGYLPATIGRRVSPFDLEIRMRPESTQVDASDPLDP